MRHLRAAILGAVFVASACSTASTATTEALLATTALATTAAQISGASSITIDAGGRIVPAGCEGFDPETLAGMTPVDNLALLQSESTSAILLCNFVGVGSGLDTAIRIEVETVDSKPEGHYVVAGEFESELEIAGVPGVGSGRGILRLQLDATRGLTLSVIIRGTSSDAEFPTDGQYLAIRDAVAVYLVATLA